MENIQLIENLESKIKVLKQIQIKESDLYKSGKMQGMLDGLEYSLEEIKRLPIWIPINEKIIEILFGILIGILIGVCIKINF